MTENKGTWIMHVYLHYLPLYLNFCIVLSDFMMCCRIRDGNKCEIYTRRIKIRQKKKKKYVKKGILSLKKYIYTQRKKIVSLARVRKWGKEHINAKCEAVQQVSEGRKVQLNGDESESDQVMQALYKIIPSSFASVNDLQNRVKFVNFFSGCDLQARPLRWPCLSCFRAWTGWKGRERVDSWRWWMSGSMFW